ncbi:hypothetical protein BDN72DRAFT_895987, partial [Pluteus cervinus]
MLPPIAPAIGLLVAAQAIKGAHYMAQSPEDEASATLLVQWLVLDLALCASIFLSPLFGLQQYKAWVASALLLSENVDLVLYQRLVAAEQIDFFEFNEPHGRKTTPPHKSSPWNLLQPFKKGPDGNQEPYSHGQHDAGLPALNTAQMNPDGGSFCISQADGAVFIPILLNNIRLAGLRYSFGDVRSGQDDTYNSVATIDLTHQQLKHMETKYHESCKKRRDCPSGGDMEKTQSLVYVQ